MGQHQAAPPTPALPTRGREPSRALLLLPSPSWGEPAPDLIRGAGGWGAAGAGLPTYIPRHSGVCSPETTGGTQGTMVSLTGKAAIVTGAAKKSQGEVRRDQ
jgi:hypothetical protein